MGELAAEEIDSGNELLQDVEPAALDIPTQRLVPTVSGFAGGFCGRVLPDVLVEVFVFQNAEDKRLVVLKNGNKVAGAIQRVDLAKERLPTTAMGSGFQSGLIPLAVERVEGNPLVEQDLVGVANRIELFDFAHPTARSMKANRGGMLGADRGEPITEPIHWQRFGPKYSRRLARPGIPHRRRNTEDVGETPKGCRG